MGRFAALTCAAAALASVAAAATPSPVLYSLAPDQAVSMLVSRWRAQGHAGVLRTTKTGPHDLLACFGGDLCYSITDANGRVVSASLAGGLNSGSVYLDAQADLAGLTGARPSDSAAALAATRGALVGGGLHHAQLGGSCLGVQKIGPMLLSSFSQRRC